MGNTIQSIHLLDISFKRRQKELKQAIIPSPYEWSFKGEDRKNICAYLKEQEGLLKANLPSEMFKSLSRGRIYFGFENLLNAPDVTCSLDYFSKPPQIWLFEPKKTKNDFLEEKLKLGKEHPFFTEENLFLDWKRLEGQEKKTEHKPKIKKPESNKTKQVKQEQKESDDQKQKDFKSGKQNTNPRQNPLIKIRANFLKSPFLKDLKDKDLLTFRLKDFSSFLFKKDKNLKEDLKKLPVSNIVFTGPKTKELKTILFKEQVLSSPNENFFEEKSLIFLSTQIKESFSCGDTAYLRAEDFMLKKTQNMNHLYFFKQKAKALEFSRLEVGDMLVHRQHGIGEFIGLKIP